MMLSSRSFLRSGAGLVAALVLTPTPAPPLRPPAPIARPSALRFEPNLGQFSADVRFVARHGNVTLVARSDGPLLTVGDSAAEAPTTLQLRLDGGRGVVPEASEPLPGVTNYYRGAPEAWRSGVPGYGRLTFASVLEGIDLVFHGEEGQLEYDFVVAPGADPSRIALQVGGAESTTLTAAGELSMQTAHGALVQHAPVVYQRGPEGRTNVAARYVVREGGSVGFELASYDRAREVVIDPVLVYASYLGAEENVHTRLLAVDAAGNTLLAGTVDSEGLPTAAAEQDTFAGAPSDAFVTKTSPTGALVYSTYLGGAALDVPRGLVVDATGNAWVAGYTSSTDFPTVAAAQGTKGAGPDLDGFVAKLGADGALVTSTYLGGSKNDELEHLAIDPSGNIAVSGRTSSTDFPTLGANQPALGGQYDAFVVKLEASGTQVYGSYLGGAGYDESSGLAFDAAGRAFIAGYTRSTDFPTSAGAFQTGNAGGYEDAFVTALDAAGARVYSTYVGGSGQDHPYVLAVDPGGRAVLAGTTDSADFPIGGAATQTTRSGFADAFVTRLAADGAALVHSTYLGGTDRDVPTGLAVDADGNAALVGWAQSTDLPLQAPFATSGPGFFARISATGATTQESYLETTETSVSGWLPGAVAVTAAGDAYVPSTTLRKIAPSGDVLFTLPLDGWTATALARNEQGVLALATSTLDKTLPTQGAFADAGAGGQAVYLARYEDLPLTLTPATSRVARGAALTFEGHGGSAGYTYSLATNESGASLDPATGAYTAGTTDGVTDVVQVTDRLGEIRSASVDVEKPGTRVDAGGGGDDDDDDDDVAGDDDDGASSGSRSGAATEPEGGCGCRTAGTTSVTWPAGGMGLALALALLRRQQRRGRAT